MGIRGQKIELLPGTLDMLVLKILTPRPLHGYGIAQQIHTLSEGVLDVGEGSLYPALQRLSLKNWVISEWGITENKRRARYYRLTPDGRRQVERETREFARSIGAIARVMRSAASAED
ncbi:MAG TPA: PadR family transcriptional regulator [Bryobacteraceae bacterium]